MPADAQLLAAVVAFGSIAAALVALHYVERWRARTTQRIELPPRASHEPPTHVHHRRLPYDWARTRGWPNQ